MINFANKLKQINKITFKRSKMNNKHAVWLWIIVWMNLIHKYLINCENWPKYLSDFEMKHLFISCKYKLNYCNIRFNMLFMEIKNLCCYFCLITCVYSIDYILFQFWNVAFNLYLCFGFNSYINTFYLLYIHFYGLW